MGGMRSDVNFCDYILKYNRAICELCHDWNLETEFCELKVGVLMTTKDWLSRGLGIESEIKMLMEEQRRAFQKALVGSGGKSEVPKIPDKNAVEKKYVNYSAYEAQIDEYIDELYAVRREIIVAIWRVKERRYRKLLFGRYILGYSWEKIAEKINYSDVKHVRTTLHTAALKEVVPM